MSHSGGLIGIYSPYLKKDKLRLRLRYVLDFIRSHGLEQEFIFVDDRNVEAVDLLISYDKGNNINAAIHIPYTGNIEKQVHEFPYTEIRENARLFPVESGGFDLFAAIFHTILRTEEYSSDKLDKHGRFQHKESWQYRARCIQLPIVDIWIKGFFDKLSRRIEIKPVINRSIQVTCDIDHAWKYRHLRPIGYLKKLIKAIVTTDYQALPHLMHRSSADDPYATYDKMLRIFQKYSLQAIFFLLLSGRTRMDTQQKIEGNSAYKALIDELAEFASLGIHPSYRSFRKREVITEEMKLYKDVVGALPQLSRQHYLRISYPETVKILNACGIKHDYTMAYADMEGWRNGTSYPYPWYDIDDDVQLDIVIHPLQFMDVTMTTYRSMSPEAAREIIRHLRKQILIYGGELGLLWHNSFFDGKSELWWEIFDESLRPLK